MEGQIAPEIGSLVLMKPGPLHGLTVLRFAHAFESGGGTERYLDDLDDTLLKRNAMTVIRLHLTRHPTLIGPKEESIGQGLLVRVPLPVVPGNEAHSQSNKGRLRTWAKQKARDWVLYNPWIWRATGAEWTKSLRLSVQSGQAIGAGLATAEVLRNRRVDLVMLHFFGGADADEVVTAARKAGVPLVVLNHYSNDRFLHLAIRKHVMVADGVAGVNGLDVPGYIRDRFTNLSDGIDTDFFRRSNARPLANAPAQPIVLLPARVVREKGQIDLVKAAASLRRSGIECCLAFAGRDDTSGYGNELRHEIERAGMTGCVRFLGMLNLEELRDWYGASAVVALPTYHHEGLPRVILEAQAMSAPVVAYATGGVGDGIVSGKTGYLLTTGDVLGLANHLRELLSSASLRATMGECGREAAENRFSLSALADRHERYYSQVLSARTAGKAVSNA
ncbi:MAG: glycosyl transferase, group 1 [Verrucomicrobiales bacterium]|nr:glycosyl transferase, group 1 [Verrucomicrobiales bacterium]